MTDTQPEALRLAQELDAVPETGADPQTIQDTAAELRRLHAYCQELESHLILDCMTHVQNPAENEHVAGDVSKNGAELNMTCASHGQAPAAVAGCTRSHPHENMDSSCRAKTAIAEMRSKAVRGAEATAQDLERFVRMLAAAPSPTAQAARAMADALEPVVTLVWDKSDDGTYKAVMTVSGLQSEQQAQAAVAHMQRLFCGQEQEPHHG